VALDFEYPGVATDEGADFTKLHLLTDPLVAVLPAAHPLAARPHIVLEELADEAWIAGCERCRGHLLHACARAGFAPRIVFATDDYVAVQSLIAADLGVALLPRLVFGLVHTPGITVVELTPAPTRTITAIVRGDERKPPAITAAVTALRASARFLRI
jgi:DNA-binding transcriptional LysR family regulator